MLFRCVFGNYDILKYFHYIKTQLLFQQPKKGTIVNIGSTCGIMTGKDQRGWHWKQRMGQRQIYVDWSWNMQATLKSLSPIRSQNTQLLRWPGPPQLSEPYSQTYTLFNDFLVHFYKFLRHNFPYQYITADTWVRASGRQVKI